MKHLGRWIWLVGVGCDDSLFAGNPQPSGVVLADVTDIIDRNCISCHSGLTAPAGLDLSTDFCGTVLDGRIVAAGNPEASLLYLRMRSTSDPMPPTGRLSEDAVETVWNWISEGAECEGVEPGVLVDTGDTLYPGASVYAISCAGCHGQSGGGGSGPAMTSVVPGRTAQDIADVALMGAGTMPRILADEQEALDVGTFAVATWGDGAR